MSVATHIEVPAEGRRILPGEPIPANPIIPFIEGDGIGVDITPVMREGLLVAALAPIVGHIMLLGLDNHRR